MRFTVRLCCLILFPALLLANKIDPQKYAQTATVVSVKIQTEKARATITDAPPVLKASDPRAINHPDLAQSQRHEVKAYEVSFVQIAGNFNNLEYVATGDLYAKDPCVLSPGTYQVLAQGLTLRVLTKDKHGKPAECRFQITQEQQPSSQK